MDRNRYSNLENIISHYNKEPPSYNFSNMIYNFNPVDLTGIAKRADEFREVLDAWERNARMTGHPDIDALRGAYKVYTQSQLETASVFAHAGDFESFDKHFINASTGIRLSLGHKQITLENDDEDFLRAVFDTAIVKTPPDYFMGQMLAHSRDGDVEKTRKYASFLTMAVIKQETVVPGARTFKDGLLRIHKLTTDAVKNAYYAAWEKILEESISYAVRKSHLTSEWSRRNSTSAIEANWEKTKTLLMSYADMRSNPSQTTTAMVALFNEEVTPFFTALINCVDDPSHPLRVVYKESPGMKAVKTTSAAILPFSFYERQVGSTRIPIVIPLEFLKASST